MQSLDKKMQRRVWARVYDQKDESLTRPQRQALRQCLERSRENLALYEKLQSHGLYAGAFDRLRLETEEQIKMLRQMLR